MKLFSGLGLCSALTLSTSCGSASPQAADSGSAEPTRMMAQLFLASIVHEQGVRDLVAEPSSHFMFPFRLYLEGSGGLYSEELPTELFPSASAETLSSFSTDQNRLSAFCTYLQEEDPGITRLATSEPDAIHALVKQDRPVLHVLGVGYNKDRSEYLVCYRIFSADTRTRTYLQLFKSDLTGTFQQTASYHYSSSG